MKILPFARGKYTMEEEGKVNKSVGAKRVVSQGWGQGGGYGG